MDILEGPLSCLHRISLHCYKQFKNVQIIIKRSRGVRSELLIVILPEGELMRHTQLCIFYTFILFEFC